MDSAEFKQTTRRRTEDTEQLLVAMFVRSCHVVGRTKTGSDIGIRECRAIVEGPRGSKSRFLSDLLGDSDMRVMKSLVVNLKLLAEYS
jgi:hypothetical protein